MCLILCVSVWTRCLSTSGRHGRFEHPRCRRVPTLSNTTGGCKLFKKCLPICIMSSALENSFFCSRKAVTDLRLVHVNKKYSLKTKTLLFLQHRKMITYKGRDIFTVNLVWGNGYMEDWTLFKTHLFLSFNECIKTAINTKLKKRFSI